MFFFLSKILDALFSPYTWGFGLMALALAFRRPKKPLGKRLRVASLVGFFVTLFFSLEPVANRITMAAEANAKTPELGNEHFDAVILLGGVLEDRPMHRTGQRAYNGNVERLLTSYDLWKRGVADVVIVSGSSPTAKPGTVEADVLADQLVDWGMPRDKVVLENKSLNTRENAVFTMKIAEERGYRRLLLVTSAFHMKRAVACFVAVGAHPTAYPVDYRAYDPSVFSGSLIPRVEAFSRSSEMLRELAGRLVYRVKGFAVYED